MISFSLSGKASVSSSNSPGPVAIVLTSTVHPDQIHQPGHSRMPACMPTNISLMLPYSRSHTSCSQPERKKQKKGLTYINLGVSVDSGNELVKLWHGSNHL
ncbi:hypothetical protein MJO28_006983 [Puccinia striiformis f. sp. tritici]|uniref:Uncharacterized protein n=1 Tax=Puccinia striiformis f. sp. tritici TaxID=168172 RepID=A0ACC0EEV6_9BASI|nr:hypothetical protein MJO28_006983 [Puccinia striiformis f. sp. tritici]